MMTSEKWGCRETVAALVAYGIRHVVGSPGSRNAPLLITASRCRDIKLTQVVDERSAAFIALGIAEITGEGVALICTSGTALLNYAPAVAEAYYRHLPLIVISADRQPEWIDQDDSQTIRQPGALAAIVKHSYAIKGEAESREERWFVNRTLNEALTKALNGRRGPVHINISLSMPLTGEAEADNLTDFRKINLIAPKPVIDTETARTLAAELIGKKVLIFGGINQPDAKLGKAIASLATLPNVSVMAEGLANIHCQDAMWNVETLISRMTVDEAEELTPDVLITFGGAPVGAAWKRVARMWQLTDHWHVGVNETIIDTYMQLTRRVEFPPEGFFPRLAGAMKYLASKKRPESDYSAKWHEMSQRFETKTSESGLLNAWSGLMAVGEILKSVPERWNLQFSNGMAVRYGQMYDLSRFHRVDCNRGVSGIDGSLSTAVGASSAYASPTLLITGDMSAQYDVGALASSAVSPRLKIVVLNNGGGGIFSFVKTTATLPERDKLFKCELRLPLEQLAEAYGMRYVRATDKQSLGKAVAELKTENSRPVIAEIVTDAENDANILRQILNQR